MTEPDGRDLTPFSERRIHHSLQLVPKRTAVLVVDMLNDFLDVDGAMPLEGGEVLYEPQNRLIEAARRAGSPIVWVCDEHPPDDLEFTKRSVHCIAGSWGAQIVPQLDARPD